ncbi:MAG: lipid A deacylase LpxR family protein [Daejeonella sp.]
MKSKILYLLLITLPVLCFGQDKTFKSEFGFRTDNDAYLGYGQDRYYTNGLFVNFRHATDQSNLKKSVNKIVWEIEAGQKMYNPISGSITEINQIDRPFAAYLYGGGNLSFFYNSENSIKINLQAGTIGPSALGKEVQTILHDVVGFYQIEGWETQVKDELGFNAQVDFDNLLYRLNSGNADFSLNSNLNIGNTFSGLGAGVLFRAGSLNPFYNSASSNSRVSNHAAADSKNTRESFFYAKPYLQFVAYDATTEGGLFRSDKGPVTFDVKPLVFSQQVGYMYAKNRFTFDFSFIFKSREIKSSAKAHQYGSIAMYYRFNENK